MKTGSPKDGKTGSPVVQKRLSIVFEEPNTNNEQRILSSPLGD